MVLKPAKSARENHVTARPVRTVFSATLNINVNEIERIRVHSQSGGRPITKRIKQQSARSRRQDIGGKMNNNKLKAIDHYKIGVLYETGAITLNQLAAIFGVSVARAGSIALSFKTKKQVKGEK